MTVLLLKKFYDYSSSSNILIKWISIISLVMFFPLFLMLYFSYVVFGIATDIIILTLIFKQKQKEKLIKKQERIKEQRIIAHKNNAKEFEPEIVKFNELKTVTLL